jgi:tRNA threonylcarbamoyladenosine biosynthesis protein TsaB
MAELYFSHLDARRNEIYLEIYDANLAVIKKMHACILDDQSFKEYADRSILFCGNSNIKIKEICSGLKQTVFVDSFPEAAFLAKEASEKWQIKDFEDLAYFEPSYLKDFIPGKPKKFLL